MTTLKYTVKDPGSKNPTRSFKTEGWCYRHIERNLLKGNLYSDSATVTEVYRDRYGEVIERTENLMFVWFRSRLEDFLENKIYALTRHFPSGIDLGAIGDVVKFIDKEIAVASRGSGLAPLTEDNPLGAFKDSKKRKSR